MSRTQPMAGSVAQRFADAFRSGAQGADIDCDAAQALALDITALNARIAELEDNERAYEEIIGKKTYREVADELAATHQSSPVSETLLPCPFCGGRANVYTNEVDFVTKWSVGCGDCNCNMDVCEDTPADASVEWNTRTPGHAQTPAAWQKRWRSDPSDGWMHVEPRHVEAVQSQGWEVRPLFALADTSTGRKAPASCPNCYDETDCANVDICNAVSSPEHKP